MGKNNDFMGKLKEFFWPSNVKIITTISVMIGLFALFLVTQSTVFGQAIASYVYYLPFTASLPFTYQGSGAISPSLISTTLFVLTFVAQFYLFSCLLVFIYNKSGK